MYPSVVQLSKQYLVISVLHRAGREAVHSSYTIVDPGDARRVDFLIEAIRRAVQHDVLVRHVLRNPRRLAYALQLLRINLVL